MVPMKFKYVSLSFGLNRNQISVQISVGRIGLISVLVCKMENKIGPGRRAKVDFAKQLEIYKSHIGDLIENGYVKPATREIFLSLSEKLKMTPKAIHLSIIRHSKEIFGTVYTCEKFQVKRDDEEMNEEVWSCGFL